MGVIVGVAVGVGVKVGVDVGVGVCVAVGVCVGVLVGCGVSVGTGVGVGGASVVPQAVTSKARLVNRHKIAIVFIAAPSTAPGPEEWSFLYSIEFPRR